MASDSLWWWSIGEVRRWIERGRRIVSSGKTVGGLLDAHAGTTAAVLMDGNEDDGDDLEGHVNSVDYNEGLLTLPVRVSLISRLERLIFKSAAQSVLQRRQVESAVDDSATAAPLEPGRRRSGTLQRFIITPKKVFVKFTFEGVIAVHISMLMSLRERHRDVWQ